MSAIFIFLGALFWVFAVFATYVQIPRRYAASRTERLRASIRVNVIKAIRERHSLGLFAAAFQSFSLYLILVGVILAAVGDRFIESVPPQVIVIACMVAPAVMGTLVLERLVRK